MASENSSAALIMLLNCFSVAAGSLNTETHVEWSFAWICIMLRTSAMFTGKWLLDILSEVVFAGTEFSLCDGQYVSPTCPDHLCTLMEKNILLLVKRNILHALHY